LMSDFMNFSETKNFSFDSPPNSETLVVIFSLV
jgi:hypothetical protein